jgi:dCTP deaminase
VSVIPLIAEGPNRTIVQQQAQFSLEAPAVLILNADREQLVENDDSNVSYDLRIGQQCRNHVEKNVNNIAADGVVKLPPGAAFIIQTEEDLHLPRQMYGTIAPKVSLLQRGISTTFSKVDPGYHGHLLITLFNLGKNTVVLKRKDRFCALTLFEVRPGARTYDRGPKQIAASVTKQPRRGIRDWLSYHQVSVSVVSVVVTLLVILEQALIAIWSIHHSK